jgi:large subunit ribosomal protein L25
MVEVSSLVASARTQSGKGPARAARRAGMVPAVIYGNKLDAVPISVERKELERQIQIPGFFIRLVDVKIDGEAHRVLPRDVQFHPVTDIPLHVDFLRFSADREITVEVPVQFLNEEESPGIKRGGVLNIVRHEVEVQCTADNIPQIFEIDLTGLEIGDAVHASMIPLPDGVSFTITDRDFTIATVAAPTVVAEEAAAEGEEGEEGEAMEGAEAAEGETEGEASGEEAGNEDEG